MPARPGMSFRIFWNHRWQFKYFIRPFPVDPGPHNRHNNTDAGNSKNDGNVGKDIGDMGKDVVDGVKDAGDAVADGVDDAIDAVDPDADTNNGGKTNTGR